MADDNPFPELFGRVRAGDGAAAAELVRRYETYVRVAVRARIHDPALRRYFDSQDVCQSVLASFFVRAAAGQYDLDGPDQLLRLLADLARRKLRMQVRRWRRHRRDYRRVVADGGHLIAARPDGRPAPDRLVAGRELVERVRERLSAEERLLADERGAGLNWAEVAERHGGSAEGRRKQLARALDRAAAELGIDEGDDDDTPG